ncbi:MAG: hypothetical protein ABIZ30_02015 [Candidatus Limnocylindrales bacterium]
MAEPDPNLHCVAHLMPHNVQFEGRTSDPDRTCGIKRRILDPDR